MLFLFYLTSHDIWNWYSVDLLLYKRKHYYLRRFLFDVVSNCTKLSNEPKSGGLYLITILSLVCYLVVSIYSFGFIKFCSAGGGSSDRLLC